MRKGAGEYRYLENGILVELTNWQDFPDVFDELICFNPTPPPQPHSQADHDYLETFLPKFREICSRARSY